MTRGKGGYDGAEYKIASLSPLDCASSVDPIQIQENSQKVPEKTKV